MDRFSLCPLSMTSSLFPKFTSWGSGACPLFAHSASAHSTFSISTCVSFLTPREQELGYHEAVSREDAHLQRLMHSGTQSYKVLWNKKNKRFVFGTAGRVQSRSKGKTSNSEVQFPPPCYLSCKQIFKSNITDCRYIMCHQSWPHFLWQTP